LSEGRAKKTVLFVFKVTVSVLAVAFLLSRLDIRNTFGFLALSNKPLWLLSLLILVLSQVISSYRWYLLLQPLDFTLSWFRVFKIYFTGMFFSLFLPTVVGGDAVKTFYIADNMKRAPSAFYTVLADRVIGMAGQQVFALAGVVLVWGYFPFWLSAGLFSFVLVYYVTIFLLPRLFTLVHTVVKKLRELPREKLFIYWNRPYTVLKAWGLSLAIHLCVTICHILIGVSLGFKIPIAAYMVVYPVSAIVATLPLSLNGIGLREAAYVYMLGFFGVGSEEAFALGLMWFSIVLLNGAIGGIPYLFGGQLKLDEIRKSTAGS
jgi:uncharacterized membrane protein YbhN (UPF0104 family)